MATLTMPSWRLDGRRALVTGASRGIGLAAAHALAQAGAEVVLAARGADDLQAACADIRAAGGRAEAWVLDVCDTAAVREGLQRLAPCQILVNNAGTNRPRHVLDVSDEDLDALLALNLRSTYVVAREFARALVAAGLPGSVINVSSQMGHVGSPGRSVYCATKHGMEGMTKALACDLGPHGIRVNTLCPTFVETDMTRDMLRDDAFREFVMGHIVLGRLARLEDLMGPVVFLASDASAMVTGTALLVDGGWTAS
ncbi:MAG TPA: 3-oxoacyl-ACP reductase [Comamonadaceae bacterium]|uniref:SDR family NAD(P)-dependent oxidoreductase n=1 Tax=Pulveribacter sp. TaxID=2678893 RepID=UPI000ED21748|nr:SDR family NAD(P)-dependent oxidoreductase [Pulveribacter sp.]HCL85346.1 3-oxoacyl-ACP reductase [Comamonadaceae bacterium]